MNNFFALFLRVNSVLAKLLDMSINSLLSKGRLLESKPVGAIFSHIH